MIGSTNLIPQPSQWVNLPTRAVRLPEVFIPQILPYSHQYQGLEALGIALGGKDL